MILQSGTLYIINGLDKNIHNPDTVTGEKLSTLGVSWNALRGSDDTAMLSFNHGHSEKGNQYKIVLYYHLSVYCQFQVYMPLH